MLPVCFEGQHAKDRSAVTCNVFSIPERLKELDHRFFVMFNHKTQKFEVHVTGQQGTTLGLELPYPDLDYRAITYTRDRMTDRFDEMAKEVDRHNEKLQQTSLEHAFDKSNAVMKEAITWAVRHPSKQESPEELLKQ